MDFLRILREHLGDAAVVRMSRTPKTAIDLDRSIAPKGLKLAGGYLRKSKLGDLDLQRDSVTRQAKRLGAVIVDWYVDNERSASRYRVKDREDFERMVGDICSGRINMVIFYDSDRFSRDPAEIEDMIDLCEEYRDLTIEHEKGVFDLRTDDGRMMARFMCSRAAGESDATSRREKERHAQIAKEGRPSGGGLRSFGYDDDGLTVREDEAKMIRQAAKRVLAGATLHSICKEWNDAGIASPGGARWRTPSLKRILMSARIAGLREHHEHRVVRNRKEGTRRQVKEHVATVPAVWSAIISEADHKRLRIKLASGQPGAFPARRYLLTGILRCGREGCGNPLSGGPRNGKDGYMCGDAGCRRCGTAAGPLDEWVWEAVMHRYESRAFAKEQAKQRRAAKAAAKSGKDPAADVERIKAKLDRLSVLCNVEGTISEGEWLAARGPLLDQLAAAEAEMGETTTQDLDAAGVDFTTVRQRWDAGRLGDDERRALILGIVETITLAPGERGGGNRPLSERVKIRWRY